MGGGLVVFLISLPFWAFITVKAVNKAKELKLKNIGTTEIVLAAVFFAMCFGYLSRNYF